VFMWDNRRASPTYRARQIDVVGADKPMMLVIPVGVVHAYKNVGGVPGLVFNCPNRLYKGPGKKEPVDEVRHEGDPASPCQLDGDWLRPFARRLVPLYIPALPVLTRAASGTNEQATRGPSAFGRPVRSSACGARMGLTGTDGVAIFPTLEAEQFVPGRA